MSTPAYAQLVDTKSETEEAPSEVEELQSLGSRVPFMGDEFEAFEPTCIRTDSSHSSALSDSTAPLSPNHPLNHVLPTLTPTRVSFHCRTARMAVRTQPTLSLGMSARIAKAVVLSQSSFHKRYRSSYETSSSSSSLTLPVRKRYRGIYVLILDTDSEGDKLREEDTKEDEEDKSLDADDERESQGLGDVDHGFDDESQGLKDEGLGLKGEEAAPEDPEDDRVYTDILAYAPPAAPVQTSPSPEWSLGSFLVSPSSPVVPSPIALPVATPTDTISVDEDQFIEVGKQLELHGNIDRDVREMYTRSGAAGRVDTRLAYMSRDRYDDHRLIHDMLVQQAAIHHELQEMRGHVNALEQERDRREQ
ncbi:hypothetical protein Tco_1231609 [Tanacetum coccineum]